MDIIHQTNRTILFEEINPQKQNLLALLSDNSRSECLGDEKILEINRYLLVKSFDDFLDKFSPCVYSFYSEISRKTVYTLEKPQNVQAKYVEVIELNRSNDFMRMLFYSIDFNRSFGVRYENVNEFLELKNAIEEAKQENKDFVKAAKPLIESILGVKLFFDQYNSSDKGMQPALLVTNCKPLFLLEGQNANKFKAFLNTVNTKNDFSETIWFGILPSVNMESSKKMIPERTRFGKKTEDSLAPVKEQGNSMELAENLLEILKEYKIQLFFSFLTSDKTTFSNMVYFGIDRYIDQCHSLIQKSFSEFAIPCIPNFTIIDKEISLVPLEAFMDKSKSSSEFHDLWLEGIYVNASYVAAGIVAAYQCPEFLKDRFINVHPAYPAVRFNIESGENNLKVSTTLRIEIPGFTDRLRDALNKKNFGFVFSCEDAEFEGENTSFVTVCKARCLARYEDEFDSVFKTLTTNYITRILQFKTNDYRKNHIQDFFGRDPVKSQRLKWEEDSGYINSIFQPGDSVNYIIDNNTCKINFMLSGKPKSIDIETT